MTMNAVLEALSRAADGANAIAVHESIWERP